MEYIVILFVPELLQAVDHKSLLIRNGISVGGQDHADGGPVVIEFQIDLVQGPVNAGLKYIHNVVFQSGQHHLGLRISEAGIVFQYLGAVFRQHQTEEDHALKGTAFGLHGVHRRLVNMLLTVGIHFLRIEGAGGIVSHTAGV